MANQGNEVSKSMLYGIMTGMLLTGTANTVFTKLMDEQYSLNQYYTHPYLQTAVMFLGELTCLPAYAVKKYIQKRNELKSEAPDLLLSPGAQVAKKTDLPTNINPLLIAIPASCDFLGSSLMFVALTMTPASVYQMMRGIIVVITCIMSVVFLGKKQYAHHWTGVIMIVFGVAWVGVVAIAGGYDNDSATGSMVVGIILLLISQCFAGTQFITEEILLGGYYLDPFKVVGTEGMFGLMYYLCILPGLQWIQCDFALCNFGRFEDSAYAFHQMMANGWIIALYCGIICSIASFNVFGISTTKYASAAQRSTVDTSRTLLIWVIDCLFLGADFQPLAIVGFVFLVLGTLLYNEIVTVSVCGLNNNTKAAIAARKEQSGEDASAAQDAAYMASSPAATYDTSRNKRLLARVAADEQEEYAKDDAKSSFVLNLTDQAVNKSDISASDC